MGGAVLCVLPRSICEFVRQRARPESHSLRLYEGAKSAGWSFFSTFFNSPTHHHETTHIVTIGNYLIFVLGELNCYVVGHVSSP